MVGPIEAASAPAVTKDVNLRHGVVRAILDENFGLIYGPCSAKSDGER